MYGGVIAPPLIVGGAAGLSASDMALLVTAVAIAVGIIPIAAPTFWDAFPEWLGVIMHSGISASALVAVVLNYLFNEITVGNKPGASVFAASEDQRDEFGDRLDDDIQRSTRHDH